MSLGVATGNAPWSVRRHTCSTEASWLSNGAINLITDDSLKPIRAEPRTGVDTGATPSAVAAYSRQRATWSGSAMSASNWASSATEGSCIKGSVVPSFDELERLPLLPFEHASRLVS